MFDDPKMPDFDSMSQDELIAWLETLAKRQREEGTETSGEYQADIDQQDLEPAPEGVEDEWSEWIEDDEQLQQETPPAAEKALQPVQELDEEDEDETPTALTTIGDSGSDDTTDPLNWLEDVAAESVSAELRAGADQGTASDSLNDLVDADDSGDPLEWLESLANEVSGAAGEISQGMAPEVVDDDIDDAYEDDETFEDGEDESLYSQPVGESSAFPESLMRLDEPIVDDFSTQSMAPLPDFLVPASDEQEGDLERGAERESVDLVSSPVSQSFDSLTHAFLMQDQQAELEAWYAERLRTVAATGDTASKPTQRAASSAEALKPPPPGLAAGFNSARGKIADGKVDEALGDYETLLRANIGLDLVVSDMQWLINQAQHQDNPAVHRVLGDALMRRGQLQQALDAYRHALKLL